MAAGLCAGCSRIKFSFESNNLMGFEGYYYDDGEVYVIFDKAKLDVYPEPDTVIRVYMVFMPVDEPVEVPEANELIMPSTAERQGFTVVEWGGSILREQ